MELKEKPNKKTKEKPQGINKLWIMDYIIPVLLLLLAISMVFVLCLELKAPVEDLRDTVSLAQLSDNITAGTVIGKSSQNSYYKSNNGIYYANGKTGYAIGLNKGSYVPKKYYLEVGGNTVQDGQELFVSKKFEVERDVYLAYNIGDWFDSQNFRHLTSTEEAQYATDEPS